MEEREWMVDRFEAHRTHLRAVAYRMLGSTGEADDAVQDAWLRFSHSDTAGVQNLGGWLNAVVSRVCLAMLRSRRSRREAPLEEPEVRVPDPIVAARTASTPSRRRCSPIRSALRCSWCCRRCPRRNVSRSCCTTCSGCPSGRYHPSWDVPRPQRDNSRAARRRVRGTAAVPDADLLRQREVVAAFLAAAREGDFEALLAVLAEGVVVRADYDTTPTGASRLVRGARAVAEGALTFSRLAR